jgi:glycosyltransferase involved in cell wall biosynthesis
MSTPTQSRTTESSSQVKRSIKIVSRYFWPYSGAREMGVADLAQCLADHGHSIEVLTVAWNKDWPSEFRFQGVQVKRLVRPGHGPWGSYRYLKQLGRAIAQAPTDLVIVCGLGEELVTAQRMSPPGVPFLVRLDEHTLGTEEDSRSIPLREMQALAEAEKVMVESAWTRDRLLRDHNLNAGRVLIAADAIDFERSPQRDGSRQAEARHVLSQAHPMLQLIPEQPLAVSAAPANGDKGWLDLVEAWQRVTRKFPNAKFWIVGDGPRSRRVWDAIVDRQLVDSMIMLGQLDELDDLFDAADLYVHPLRRPVVSSMLLRAMGAGLPALVVHSPEFNFQFEDRQHCLVVSPCRPRELATCMIDWFEDSNDRQAMGQRAREWVLSHFSLPARLSEYLAVAGNRG